jgi:hypothetical protein
MRTDLKLVPDLIPATSFFKNLRTTLSSHEWDIVRFAIYRAANYRCQICGEQVRVLDCHEVWEYDEKTGVQKLAGLLGICKDCHEVKHIGLAQMRGRMGQATDHMAKVNGMDRESTEAVIAEAFKIWRQRSQRKWTMDVSALESLIRKSSIVCSSV